MESVQAPEIQVSVIHDVVGTGTRNQVVQGVDIVQFSVRDQNELGNGAVQVEQGMQFDCPLGTAEARPGEDREAQVDGRGIQGIDGRVQVDSQVLVGVQAARFGDKHLGKLGIDAPVAPLVGIGQIVAGDRGANAHVEELGSHGR